MLVRTEAFARRLHALWEGQRERVTALHAHTWVQDSHHDTQSCLMFKAFCITCRMENCAKVASRNSPSLEILTEGDLVGGGMWSDHCKQNGAFGGEILPNKNCLSHPSSAAETYRHGAASQAQLHRTDSSSSDEGWGTMVTVSSARLFSRRLSHMHRRLFG